MGPERKNRECLDESAEYSPLFPDRTTGPGYNARAVIYDYAGMVLLSLGGFLPMNGYCSRSTT